MRYFILILLLGGLLAALTGCASPTGPDPDAALDQDAPEIGCWQHMSCADGGDRATTTEL